MRRVLLGAIGAYRRWVSPALPGACRYVPSCSEYAQQAIERHGSLRGASLAARRLLRCHPLGGSGLDPVPTVTPRGGLPSRIPAGPTGPQGTDA